MYVYKIISQLEVPVEFVDVDNRCMKTLLDFAQRISKNIWKSIKLI